MSDTGGAGQLFEAVMAAFGRVDVLVNNAGTIHRSAAEEVELEDWQRVLQVNLTSNFQLSRLAARQIWSATVEDPSLTLLPCLAF